jgi:hypothetical protein
VTANNSFVKHGVLNVRNRIDAPAPTSKIPIPDNRYNLETARSAIDGAQARINTTSITDGHFNQFLFLGEITLRPLTRLPLVRIACN